MLSALRVRRALRFQVPTIVEAVCENQDSQRRFRVRAKTYIDATGDGRLGVEAGAEWLQGREAQATYNESLAGEYHVIIH